MEYCEDAVTKSNYAGIRRDSYVSQAKIPGDLKIDAAVDLLTNQAKDADDSSAIRLWIVRKIKSDKELTHDQKMLILGRFF